MNIYVGNLPKSVDNNELAELFEQYGTVDNARVIRDRYSGDSRGFGFVTMPDRNEAETAIEELNGYELEGRSLRVNEARDRERKPRRGYNSRPRR